MLESNTFPIQVDLIQPKSWNEDELTKTGNEYLDGDKFLARINLAVLRKNEIYKYYHFDDHDTRVFKYGDNKEMKSTDLEYRFFR